MDGHEREDVIKFRNEVFLPKMKELERCMAQYIYNGTSLERKEPVLNKDEKHVIPIWHDESCFHANEFKRSTWKQLSSCQIGMTCFSSLFNTGSFRSREV